MRRKIIDLFKDSIQYPFFRLFSNSTIKHNGLKFDYSKTSSVIFRENTKLTKSAYSVGKKFFDNKSLLREIAVAEQYTSGLNPVFSKYSSIKNFKPSLYQTISRFFSTTPEKTASFAKPVIHTGGDFGKLVRESSIFIDKSLFIKEIIEDKSEVILITMPRRWGKSLNLDMLRRFLSIEEENQEQKLFNSKIFTQKIKRVNVTEKVLLDITKTKALISDSENIGESKEVEILTLQGHYPVIFIDFKDCKGTSVEDVQSKLKDKIFETVRNFSYLQNSEKAYKETTLGQEYITLLNKVKNNIFLKAIKELSELLHVYYGKKVWILIDEYDAAANKAYLEFNIEDAKQVSNLFREVYESSLKGNSENLEKGIITGVQYIVKSGMLSGLNNLSKYNVTSTKYSKYYGLSTLEMGFLLEHFNIKEKEYKIKDWYDGYKSNIGTVEEPIFIDKYNIWSVVNYLNNQSEGFKSYWENNSLGEIINKKILKNHFIKDIVEDLINNRNLVLTKLTSDFSVSDFQTLKSIIDDYDQIEIAQDGIDLLFSYLFITGYLTNTSTTNEYSIPNKEIKIEFETKIKDYYNQIFNISPSEFNELTKNIDSIFSEEDVNNISSIVRRSFAPKLSSLISKLKLYNKGDDIEVNKGLFANEDLMHSLLNNIAIQIVNAKFASERHTTKMNGEKGRADIVIEKNNKGIVIEMKYNAKDVKMALEQAKEYIELVKDADTKIFMGCNITDQQEVFISGEILSGNESIHFDYP
jgi:hypothetical protein